MIETKAILTALFGGLLIGASASLMLYLLGKITGISGILWRALAAPKENLWRWLFVFSLPLGAVLYHWIALAPLPPQSSAGPMAAILGGLLVGFGVKLGSGCTSGHGICGIARLSHRSLLATGLFMSAGIVTVAIIGLFK